MKKAVFYARVSSEIQQKEGTIKSQVAELKKQIAEAGDVLVKEYADDGYSGAKMERPALDQLRNDLKTDLFDTIYFLNADRIARDSTFQNLIIAEILKYKKQIVINGKDYVHNPENKFQLTVLGAVSELERAKIIERSRRGRLHKLRNGFLMGHGYNIYGYTYIKRTETQPAQLLINEQEAKIIRYVFETYASGKSSWVGLVRALETMGAITKLGKRNWTTVQITKMLKTQTYTGLKYYNTHQLVRERTNPLRMPKYGKKVWRDKKEWIGVKIPAIISQKLFDKVQERMAHSRSLYQSPKEKQLLSNLIRCGECGRFFFSYRRYLNYYYKYKGVTKKISHKVYYRKAYQCSRRWMNRKHIKTIEVKPCANPQVSAPVLESVVMQMIEKTMLIPKELTKCLASSEKRIRVTQLKFEKQIRQFDEDGKQLQQQRAEILDRYATGDLKQDEYLEKCFWFDNEAKKIKLQKSELIKRIPILHKKDVIDVSVRIFCETVRARFERLNNFDTKRQFCLDFIEEILYDHGKVTVKGFLPIQLQAYSDPDQSSEASRIEFSIEGSR